MSENELANYPGLFARRGVWYVRKKVPVELRQIIGMESVRKSLEVRDRRSAQRLYHARMAEIVADFEAQRAALSRQDKLSQAMLTGSLERLKENEIDALVWRWWEGRVALRHPTVEEEDDLSDVLSIIESDIQDVTAPNSTDVDPAAHIADQLLVKAGMAAAPKKAGRIATAVHYPAVDRSTRQYAYLCQRVRTALEIEAKLARLHLTGQGAVPADRMFNPGAGQSAATSSEPDHRTVGDLLDAYRAERVLALGEESTRRKFGLLFQVLEEVVGRQLPVSALRREHCVQVISFLKALPPNANKRFPNMTLTQARDHAVKSALPGLAPQTVASYNQNFSAILNWGQATGWNIKANTKGLELSRKAQVKRRGFTPSELRMIFGALARVREERPTRFWVPALALYTGARAGEICQLRAHDLIPIDDVWCLNLTEFDEDGMRVPGKSLKTPSSERFVPLHPELIAAGVLELPLRSSDLLFSDLQPGRSGHYSEGMSKWFGRFLDSVDLRSRSLVFHSFRHGFRDACRMAEGIPQETIDALGGWTSEGQATRYGDRGMVPVLARAVRKIGFGNFALSKL